MKGIRFFALLTAAALALSLTACAGASNANTGEPAASAATGGAMDSFANCAPMEALEPDWNTEEYSHMDENGFHAAALSPLSTFAADVDTASYANLRRMLLNGQEVPADAVRIEEMVDYFRYD